MTSLRALPPVSSRSNPMSLVGSLAMPLVVLVVCLQAPAAVAQEVTGEVSGYFEHRSTVVFGLSSDLADLPSALVDFDALGFHPDERYGMTHHLRPTAKLHFGERTTLLLTADAHSYLYFDDRGQDELRDFLSVERLTLFVSTEVVDLTAGKQVLNWGHGLLLNPTAPNNERPPQDLRAELEGLWAVKALFPAGVSQNVTLAIAAHEDTPDEPIAVGRWDADFDAISTAVTLTWRDEDPNRVRLGFEIKGDIEDGPSMWAETSTSVCVTAAQTPVFEVEAGLDYTFDVLQGLYVAAEGIWHGSGSQGDYLQAAVGGGRRSVLLGQPYALLLLRQTIDSEWEAQLLSLINAYDPSGTVTAQVTWLPTGALEVMLGATFGWGTDGKGEYSLEIPNTVTVQGVSVPTPESVRGDRISPAASLFLRARYYF